MKYAMLVTASSAREFEDKVGDIREIYAGYAYATLSGTSKEQSFHVFGEPPLSEQELGEHEEWATRHDKPEKILTFVPDQETLTKLLARGYVAASVDQTDEQFAHILYESCKHFDDKADTHETYDSVKWLQSMIEALKDHRPSSQVDVLPYALELLRLEHFSNATNLAMYEVDEEGTYSATSPTLQINNGSDYVYVTMKKVVDSHGNELMFTKLADLNQFLSPTAIEQRCKEFGPTEKLLNILDRSKLYDECSTWADGSYEEIHEKITSLLNGVLGLLEYRIPSTFTDPDESANLLRLLKIHRKDLVPGGRLVSGERNDEVIDDIAESKSLLADSATVSGNGTGAKNLICFNRGF